MPVTQSSLWRSVHSGCYLQPAASITAALTSWKSSMTWAQCRPSRRAFRTLLSYQRTSTRSIHVSPWPSGGICVSYAICLFVCSLPTWAESGMLLLKVLWGGLLWGMPSLLSKWINHIFRICIHTHTDTHIYIMFSYLYFSCKKLSLYWWWAGEPGCKDLDMTEWLIWTDLCHCFCFFHICLPWSDRTRCHDLSFWMLTCKPAFSLSSFTFIKRLFSSSLLSAIRVLSPAYLRLLRFFPSTLIPACDSSSLAFHMMYSA